MKSKPLAIAIGILLIAVIIGYYKTKTDAPVEDQSTKVTSEQTQAKTTKAEPRDSQTSSASLPSDSQGDTAQKYVQTIEKLLGDDSVSVDDAAEGLLTVAANPRAPLEVRSDALEHALDLTNDEYFGQVNEMLASQASVIPETLLQTVLDESYNRDHATQVDTALRIISGEYSEEITEEAIELLEFHTEEEHGNDVTAWQKAVENYRQAQETGDENE